MSILARPTYRQRQRQQITLSKAASTGGSPRRAASKPDVSATGGLAAAFWAAIATLPDDGAGYGESLNTGDLEAARKIADRAAVPHRALLLAGCIKAYELRALRGLPVPPAARLPWLPARLTGKPTAAAD